MDARRVSWAGALGIAIVACGLLVVPDWWDVLIPGGLLVAFVFDRREIHWTGRPMFFVPPPRVARWLLLAVLTGWLAFGVVAHLRS